MPTADPSVHTVTHSKASPDFHQRVEERLTDLEIKASFTEDLLDALNQVVVRQQSEITALLREVRELRERMPDAGDPAQTAALTATVRAQQELPPHY